MKIAMESPLRILSLVAALCFLAACGSEAASNTAAEQAAGEAAAAADGVEYGATLDEFLGATDGDASDGATDTQAEAGEFAEVEWPDLVPVGFSFSEIRERFNEQLETVEPGSAEARNLWSEIDAEQAASNDVVNAEVDGSAVRMSGFVAPITYDGDKITEFLLVPFFGACIHVPPPPSNQTVMISLAEGESLSVNDSYGAVWVTGTMTVTSTETEIGAASYSISNAKTGVQTT